MAFFDVQHAAELPQRELRTKTAAALGGRARGAAGVWCVPTFPLSGVMVIDLPHNQLVHELCPVKRLGYPAEINIKYLIKNSLM